MAPRLIAGIAMLPLLVVVGDIIGVFGGYLVSIYKLGFNPATYIHNTIDFVADASTWSPAWSRPRCSGSSSR